MSTVIGPTRSIGGCPPLLTAGPRVSSPLAVHGPSSPRRAEAVGCRDAATQRLFLEQYTRQPIEALLRERLGVTISREHIVEIGNLACSGARSGLTLVRSLIPFLIHAGYRWAAFTAADTVVGVFRRLHLEPSAARLSEL